MGGVEGALLILSYILHVLTFIQKKIYVYTWSQRENSQSLTGEVKYILDGMTKEAKFNSHSMLRTLGDWKNAFHLHSRITLRGRRQNKKITSSVILTCSNYPNIQYRSVTFAKPFQTYYWFEPSVFRKYVVDSADRALRIVFLLIAHLVDKEALS